MKRFALAAALMALCSVSIALAQLQDTKRPGNPFQPGGPAGEPDGRTVSGVFAVLKVGGWIWVDTSKDQLVLRTSSTKPEGIRETVARLDELLKGGRQDVDEHNRIAYEFRKKFGGHRRPSTKYSRCPVSI